MRLENKFEFDYKKKLEKIKITKERKVFTNEELDYTWIEILDADKTLQIFLKLIK